MLLQQKWSAFLLAICVAAGACPAGPAAAADSLVNSLLGKPDAATENTLNYAVDIRVEGGSKDVLAAIKNNSVLVQHKKKGAQDLASLVARARVDQTRLKAALYSEARYGGALKISIAEQPLDAVDPALQTVESGQLLPVVLAVTPGPLFRFGKTEIVATTPIDAQLTTDPIDFGLTPGEAARSAIIVAATDKIVQRWRVAGFPFARIVEKDIAADHARDLVDVKIVVEPGSPAVYGWINVVGARKLSNRTVAAQSALKSGKRYRPADLERTRERLRKLESIESVRVIEGEQVDGQGGIPITLAIKERKARYVGLTASVTTLDGAEVNAHWGHRNLFGEGEQLRVEGSVSQIGSEQLDRLEFDASATLTKPGVLDIDTNLFTQFRIARETSDAFVSNTALAKMGLKRRYSPQLSASIALEGRLVRVDDTFGETDYALVSMPTDVSYDTRNNRFDPSQGNFAKFRLTPAADVRTGNSFLVGETDVSGYWAIDENARAIVALRVRAGSVLGNNSLEDVPATYRFLAGGGNSVRGYEYRSLGPTVGGQVTGGLSYASSSVELRLRATKQVGIVPFVDIATVSSSNVPSGSETVNVGAGIGLRYYTALGPIRLDVAVPLTNRDDRSKFGVYVGLGQAF